MADSSPLAEAAEPAPVWRPALFWQREQQTLVCTLCPFRCRLAAGQTGRCCVRRRQADGLVTATFSSAVEHWQAVERKPLYHFFPGRPVLTLAAPGCTFRCDYCQNAVVSQYGREAQAVWRGAPVDVPAIVRQAAARGGALALSYSEPILAAELTLDLAESAAPLGVPLLWKSNGFITDSALAKLAPHLAAVNIDLKAADERRHRVLTGAPLAPVLATLSALRAAGVWLEVSTPLIDGFNTDTASLHALSERIAAVSPATPWHLLRVTPDYRRPRLRPTSARQLLHARAIAQASGLHFVYVERALGAAATTTYCPACATPLIERESGSLPRSALRDGRCPSCAHSLPGRW